MTKRLLAACGLAVVAASLLVPTAGPRALREGGTFRVAIATGFARTIDPALVSLPSEALLLHPACGRLLSYPSKPPPAGLRLAPDLAEAHPTVSRDGRRYTFAIRKDARFSTGAAVTALAFSRAIERTLDPDMGAFAAAEFAARIVGGEDVLAGKATSPSGVTAQGRVLTVELTRRQPDFPDLISLICAVPPSLPVDPEGAKAPLPSAAPYYVAQYVPGVRLLMERNPHYRGQRPHHVERLVARLGADEGSIVDEIAAGRADWGFVTVQVWADRAAGLARRYGVNKSQFFVNPGTFLRMFVLNTSRPLFRNNPKLRQAVNFAVDRKALTRELGPFGGGPTDQYLRLRHEKIYPLAGPDVHTARRLAKGRTRSGKAVLYTRGDPIDIAQAQILRRNLAKIGLTVEIVEFPSTLIFEKLATGRKDFDIGRVAWGNPDPSLLHIFDGRTIGRPDNVNWSYFNSRKYNRLLEQASRLRGAARYRAYADIDVQISRDAAPAIPVAFQNAITFVSARTGCVVRNPFLDLTAVCLK